MLNLIQAFELYDLLAPYIPKEVDRGELAISYVTRMLHNMKEGPDQDVLTKAMILLTGLSRKELAEFSSKDILDTLINKLAENRLLDLVQFMQEIGYAR